MSRAPNPPRPVLAKTLALVQPGPAGRREYRASDDGPTIEVYPRDGYAKVMLGKGEMVYVPLTNVRYWE